MTGEGIGSLGGVIFKWSREEVIRVAKTFATITDFMVHESGAYDAAKKFGLLNMQDMPWFFENRKPFGWWNEKEHVFSESRKYKTWHEFEVGSPAAHFSARKHKWVKEMDWLQNDQVPNGYWMNEENVILESTNYTNRTDFKRGCSAGYNYANEHNLWDKMPWIELKTEQRGTWNIKENVFREAKKYRTKVEFKRGCSSAYYAALRNGWIDEMTWFIKESKPRGFWQIKENVIIESKKYKSRVEFRRGNPSAYGHAVKNGWINEMTWLTRPKNYNLKWTKEKVFDVARNFNTRGALKKKYPGVYSAARSHNWFKEMDWMK